MNALILSAGLGSRVPELTSTTHKALIEINGKPLIEHTIEKLWLAGIFRIVIVVGYKSHQFDYLVAKYPGLELIFNEHFEDLNNAYSLYRALDFLEDTWILEADLWLRENIFLNYPQSSTYYLIKRASVGVEWVPNLEDGFVKGFRIEETIEPSHAGISFWRKADSKKIVEKARDLMELNPEFYQDLSKYWDHIPCMLLDQIQAKASILAQGSVYEIDSYQDYLDICEVVKNE